MESQLDPMKRNITVNELVERYLSTKTGAKHSTVANYNFVKNILKKEEFSEAKIADVKNIGCKTFSLLKCRVTAKVTVQSSRYAEF